MEDLAPGRVVAGRYTLVTEIGKGAFGVVYRAHDAQTGAQVAVKALDPSMWSEESLVERFKREAEICGHLNHPTTTRLLDVVTMRGDGIPCLVFELVRGLPLSRFLAHRRCLTLEESVHVVGGLLDSLQEAHFLGIIHRDVKLDNVMLLAPADALSAPAISGTAATRLGIPPADDPRWGDLSQRVVKVLDFGLGKLLEIEGRHVPVLTRVGVGAGTAEFVSPEQIASARDVDLRTDLYSASMLLYRLLTGQAVFPAVTDAIAAMAHIQSPIPRMPEPYRDHPIEDVYRRAAQKSREERFGTAAEMAWYLRASIDPVMRAAGPPAFPKAPEARKPAGFFGRLFGRKGR